MPLTTRAPHVQRVKTAPSNTIPVSMFGRAGERHITGTITRSEIDRNRWLTEAPQRYLVAFALLLAPTVYRELTEGNSPQTVAVVTLVIVLLLGAITSVRRFLSERRIGQTEQAADATHIASGVLLGSGPLTKGRSAANIGVYATNHGVIAVTERRGQVSEFAVHRLDITATAAGRVIGSAFMVDGDQYALRAVHGKIRPSS